MSYVDELEGEQWQDALQSVERRAMWLGFPPAVLGLLLMIAILPLQSHRLLAGQLLASLFGLGLVLTLVGLGLVVGLVVKGFKAAPARLVPEVPVKATPRTRNSGLAARAA